LQLISLLLRLVRHLPRLQVDLEFIACADLFDQTLGRFQGQQISAVDAVAEKDAGVELGDDGFDAGFRERQRRVFARGSASVILSADHDCVFAFELIRLNERRLSLRQARLVLRHAAVGVHAKELSLFRQRRIEGQILGRDDLVRVDIVAQNVRLAGDDGFHGFLQSSET
jgi:hypothetical protein